MLDNELASHGRAEETTPRGGTHAEGGPGYAVVPPIDSEPREPIVKLGNMITDRIGVKISAEDPEYYGLAAYVTDEMAEVALKMKVRKPKTLPQIAKLTGKDPQHLEELLQQMAYIGLVEFNWENPQHEKQYLVPPFVPGVAEFFNMRQSQIDEHPEIARMFERMTQLPLEAITPMVPPGGAGIGMHVIPVEQAISMENQTASVEHISHWLDKYDGKYAASPCSCRMSRAKLGEGCGDDPEDWCIGVGDMADYLVETDRGHYITREEVLEILQKAEDNGFVHEITNIDGEDKIFAICNCNVNVCNALRTSQLFNTPNMSRSAYVASVETENCVACGRCVETCPAGAVKLGQKLCSATTHAVPEYPRHELPDNVKWGPEKWSPNYRDDNRIETYDSGTSPCKTACPAHISVQGYLKLAAQGRYRDALALIKRENPLPAVCGRVCNRRCEDACTRGRVDQAVAIDEVKKFIAEQDLDPETRYVPPVVTPSTSGGFPEKVAIVGAGPAGLSCAYYLAEKGYKPTVFERNARPGGMLSYGIPSFKLDRAVVEAEVDVIAQMGVEFRYGIEVGRDVTLQELRDQGYKAFYLAIGCQGGRLAGVPGEDSEGVSVAVDFLHDVSDRLHDGESPELPGRTVVVGGGNVAVDAARTCARLGSDSVQMVCLEQEHEMPASPEERRDAMDDGVQIVCGWGPKEVLAGEDGRVSGIVFKRCTRVYGDDGRFSPEYDEDETCTFEADRVVMAIGQSIEWGGLLDGSRVELGRGRGAVADPVTYQTAEPDIFVGGDVYTGPKFTIDAIAAGHEAAISIHRFVQPNASLTIGRNPRRYVELDKDDADLSSYDNAERQQPRVDAERGRSEPFSEYVETFTEEQVRAETARCLSCGASWVDPNKCIGCGLCTTRCEFDAIHLHRERPECSKMIPTEKKLTAILANGAKREVRIRFGSKKGE